MAGWAGRQARGVWAPSQGGLGTEPGGSGHRATGLWAPSRGGLGTEPGGSGHRARGVWAPSQEGLGRSLQGALHRSSSTAQHGQRSPGHSRMLTTPCTCALHNVSYGPCTVLQLLPTQAHTCSTAHTGTHVQHCSPEVCQVLVAWLLCPRQHGPDLLHQALLHSRVLRQEVQRPGDERGGGVVARTEECLHL
jgi:hypothetical protein